MDTILRNYVDDNGMAHIEGLVTSLAGCDSECDKNCIRKDPRLKHRWELKRDGECSCYIGDNKEVSHEPRNND